eukprot:scaffold9265_cov21-Tisochrysis_lutea.AAC.1
MIVCVPVLTQYTQSIPHQSAVPLLNKECKQACICMQKGLVSQQQPPSALTSVRVPHHRCLLGRAGVQCALLWSQLGLLSWGHPGLPHVRARPACCLLH